MSTRQTRLLLNTLTGLLLVAAGGVLWWAWRLPVSERTAAAPTAPPPQTISTNPRQEAVTPMKFAGLWDRPLRRPLYDPPPKPKVVEKPERTLPITPDPVPVPPPRLNIRLIGTVIEAGRSMAIVTDASGKIDLKRVGETLDLEPEGIRVDEIQAASVTVSFEGQQRELSLGNGGDDQDRERDQDGDGDGERRRIIQ